MAKAERKQRNPVEKLQSLTAQIDNTLQALLESADKDGFVQGIVNLRSKNEEEEAKKTKLNKESREIVKILQTYPGLSRATYSFLKAKKSEYESLGVLEQYKKDLPKESSQGKKAKNAEQKPNEKKSQEATETSTTKV